MPPPLTVLLPVRDAEPYLPAALESLSAQTWGEWICLAADDGSRDRSPEILQQHAARDPRFRVLAGTSSRGVASTLQDLLAAAQTPWVSRMDADDVCTPERFAVQMAAARQQPEVHLWGTRVQPIGEVNAGWRVYLEWLNGVWTEEEIVREAFTECPLPHPSWLARRDALTDVGGYRDGPFPEDYDLFLRLLRRGARFGKVPQSLLQWRDHPARETRTSVRTDRDAFLRLKAVHFAQGLLHRGLPHLPRRPIAIWGAGKTGRILARTLRQHGLAVERIVDPVKAGGTVDGSPVCEPNASPVGRHLLLVAVGPRTLRIRLRKRFEAERRVFGRDYIWMY